MALQKVPVKPADSGVLAISIVVALLSSAHLVAHEEHRRACRQHEQREKILDLTIAQRFNVRIGGRPLQPAIPTQIVRWTIAIVVPVSLVVLVVVRNQIVESEAIVTGHEINALLRLALLVTIDIWAA